MKGKKGLTGGKRVVRKGRKKSCESQNSRCHLIGQKSRRRRRRRASLLDAKEASRRVLERRRRRLVRQKAQNEDELQKKPRMQKIGNYV